MFSKSPIMKLEIFYTKPDRPKKKIISKYSREPEVFKKASRKNLLLFFFKSKLNWIQFCFAFCKLDGTPRNALISPRILDWLVTWARSLLQNTSKQTIIVVKRTIAASTSMLVLGSRSSHSDSSELFVSLMGSMRWGKKENTVRTQAALAREWGELKRSMNNGKPGREKPGAVRWVRAPWGGMLFPGRAAHLPGNSNGSSQMKHERCQISAVVLCEAGLFRRGWGRQYNFFSPRRTLERVLTVPIFLRKTQVDNTHYNNITHQQSNFHCPEADLFLWGPKTKKTDHIISRWGTTRICRSLESGSSLS